MDTMLPKDALLRQCKCSADQLCSAAPTAKLPRGQTWRTMTQIARIEGPLALYAGLPPTLLVAIPSTALYFTGYEALYAELKRAFPERQQTHSGVFAMAAGALARTASATVFSPLELIRVQMQAVANAEPFRHYVARAWRGGRRRLFAGLGATLARDVPFSAVYWWGIESSKAALLPLVSRSEHDSSARVAVAFASGVLAGVLATVVTHPFDVVKTRAQLASYPPGSSAGPLTPSASTAFKAPSFVALLRRVAREEGAAGLAAGLVPRVAKVAPACAIMISSYEAGKLAFRIQ
jgi:solute carrier family 25 protein 39/40